MGLYENIVNMFAKTEPPNNFTGETATTVDDLYRRWSLTPYNPDMLAAKKGGLGIYKKMRDDDQVKSCLQLKKSAIITPGWGFEDGDEDHHDFLYFTFAAMDGTVEGFIYSLLSAFDYGFSLHEKIFSYVDQGQFKGKIGLKALKAKSPTRIDFDTDAYGNLKPNGILQKQDSGKVLQLPIDKFVLFTYQKESDNYYGESDLKAIYRQWFVKINVLKYWAIYLERFSVPIVYGRTNTGRVTDTQRTEFKTLITNIQAGMSALLPQDLSMDLLESTRVDRGVFEQAINGLNVGIARGILIPQMVGLVPQAGVGSYGKSETDMRTFDWVLGQISKNVSDLISEQVVRQLIDINYGEQEEYPRFVINPMKEEDKARIIASWSEAVARGAVTPTNETEKYVREMLDFPEFTDEEKAEVEKIKKEANEPKGQSGLAGGNISGGTGKVSNVPGKANQYSEEDQRYFFDLLKVWKEELTTELEKKYGTQLLPGPESRVDWEQYVKDLDGVEDAAKRELTEAFDYTIWKMIEDAKKNCKARNALFSRKQEG